MVLLFALVASGAEPSAANGKDEIIPIPPPSGPFEQKPLKFKETPVTTQPSGTAAKSGDWDFAKIPAALAGVVILIFVLRWAGKSIGGKVSNKNGGRGVEVLSRSMISPRQQMMVVRFGRKILLVGSSGGEMTPLCQIDQPDEVAEVLAQVNAGKSASQSFRSAISGAEKPYEEAEVSEPHEQTAESSDELGGLMARVRKMTERFQS
jgi:flagellar biogenesis protein FliO